MRVANRVCRITVPPTVQSPSVNNTRCGVRYHSTNAAIAQNIDNGTLYQKLDTRVQQPERPFQRLSTKALLRGVILGHIFKTPLLFKPGFYLLEKIANSKSRFLDADRNPLIRALVLPLIYKQFCAGRNVTEVKQTISDIKGMGYSGVILCFSGEVMARRDATGNHSEVDSASSEETTRQEIETWKNGNLATLDAVSEGDYIGIKYTGAGPSISHALKSHSPPPKPMLSALHEICTRAATHNKQIWIDAEQQVYHPTIDTWTTDLMRQYNRASRPVILTTIQAYLKSSRSTTEHYLRQSQSEGWTLGIKLVRGAYIASDIRSGIHDTKADTDASYDGIARDILCQSWPGLVDDDDKSAFPRVQLFLAGHNSISIRHAASLVHHLAARNRINEPVCYGQSLGMADDVGCELLAMGEQIRREALGLGGHGKGREEEREEEEEEEVKRRKLLLGTPRVYKCLTWGSVRECLHYLVRRAVENRGASERLNGGLGEMRRELWGRVGWVLKKRDK